MAGFNIKLGDYTIKDSNNISKNGKSFNVVFNHQTENTLENDETNATEEKSKSNEAEKVNPLEAFKPNLNTTIKTDFGNVKVDTTPSNITTIANNIIAKHNAEKKKVEQDKAQKKLSAEDVAKKYGYTVSPTLDTYSEFKADTRSEETKKADEDRIKDLKDYPEKSEVLAHKYNFNLTDLNNEKFKEIVSKNNIAEDSEEYTLLEDIKWVNFGKEHPGIYQTIKVAGDVGNTAESLAGSAVAGIESIGQFLLSGAHWLLGTTLEFGSDAIEAFAPAVFVDDASPVTNNIDDTAKKIKGEGKKILENKYLGEQWLDNIDERYRNVTHDSVKNNFIPLVRSAGTLAPAIATEILTASASPMGDIWVAKTFSNLAKGKATIKAVSKSDIVFGLSAAGSASSQAVREGANLDSALMYGTFNGVGEVVTEKIFSGFAGTDIGKSLIEYKSSNKLFDNVLDLGGEAFEEVLMAFADPYFRRATFDANAELPSLSDYTESAKQGILLSLLMKGATFPFTVKTSKQKSEAVKTLNSYVSGLNEIIIDENKKLALLPKNATIEDIKAKQKEIGEYANLYAQQLSSEVLSNLTQNADTINKIYEESKDELQSEAKEIYNNIANAMGVETQTPNEVPTSATRSEVDTTPIAQTPATTKAEEITPTANGVTSAYTNNNQKIDMKYKVVSADDLVVSNNIDGSINPKYPQELQPRERTRTASVMQVQDIAKNIVPEKLGESASISDGSPIVSSDNVVESGNGRTMALSLMYQTNPEGAKKYIEYIKANADKFGIDANNLPKNPVLVRERLTDVDRVEFVKQANESNLSAMSATELAKSDAERLSGDILNLLVANDDGNINTQDNKAFVGSVIENVFSQNDLNSVVGANGMLSANGLERIQNALFYKAYNDVTLASKLAESLDNDIKNITKVLLNIAPKIVQIKNGIAKGNYYDLDFSQDIVDGINYLQEAKRQDLKVKGFAKQITIGDDVSNVVKFIALFFEQKNRGAKQATLFFNHLCDTIMSKDKNQIGFLNEDAKTPTKEEIVNEAINRYNNDEQGTGIDFAEMLVSQRSEEPRQAVDTRGIGDNIESVTEQRPADSQSNGTSKQQGYVEEETALTGNIDTPRQSEGRTEERRPQNRTDETEVGAGELSGYEEIYDPIEKAGLKFGLTEDEKYAISEYKSSGSYTLNYVLREGLNLLDEQVKLKENLITALNKFPTYKGTVYRNIGFSEKEEFDSFISEHIGKSTVTYPAFTSASKDTNGYTIVNLPYTAHYVIESMNARDVAEIGIVNEQEVLFNAGSEFEITGIEVSGNNVNIKCKEITSNENFKNGLRTSDKEGRNKQNIENNVGAETNLRADNENFGQMGTVRGRSTQPNKTPARTAEHNGSEANGNVLEDSGELRSEVGNELYAQREPHNELGEINEDTGTLTTKNEGTKQIADYVAEKLAKGEKLSATELQVISAKAFGGTMADNVYSIKDAYDAMELGVNKYILSMKDVSSEKMLELLELLPTQTKRTEDQVKFQQFSTPPSIAYLANYVANVNAKDIMLEPSAGIGGIAVFAKRDGATVYVNELDNRRLEVLKNMPFDKFFNENAEQLDNILGGKIEPTVIVMNPPFSSSSERNIHNTKIGAKHIEEALKILAPNGRLVAIVGHGMGDGAPAFRDWWKDIKSKYNVRANIRINGKNYNKYGTNFDIQMLVIDKNGATTQTETGYVDTLQELQEKLGGIRNERPTIDYKGTEQKSSELTRTETSKTGKTADVGNRVISDTDSITYNGKSADTPRPSRKSNAEMVQTVDADNRGLDNQTSETTNDVDNGQTVDRRGELGGHTELQDSRRTDISDSKQHSKQSDVDRSDGDVGVRKNNVRVQRPKRTELTDSIFEQYQTQPLQLKNTKPHPAKVSESAAMSAITPPAVTYKPHIPQDIVENGVVSDVQLEAISYAGQSHSQVLPNGTTRGFFLGDGTGIGKGRTIAGMMLDNYNQGRKKALWVTLNSSLVNDAKRDVKALFGNSDLLMQFEGGGKADKIFDKNEAILVVSYSTLSRGYDKNDSNFEKLVKWLGKDFDGLIVFDEAHKMGNATSTKGTRGTKKASQTGLAGIALQEALPNARVVYSSATGATEVENLRYAERLGLWGEGTAFVTGDDFVSKIKAGGLASMELIARDMKAMGVYLSRNISYEDVQYDKITHNLTSQQTKIYDELARSWQIVLQNINKALENTNQDKDGHARGRALGAFWSSQQRFFNQILTSMQVPSVISDIEKQLADGKSCVIQLVSTNESAQNQEFERLKSEELELDEFDLTPKQVLMSMIETSFPVQQFEEYRDDEGNIKSKPVYDSMGNPVLNREAVRQRDELLEKLGSIKVPSSPIDMIINHFGTDLVAENTGRARRVIQKDGKTIEEKISNKKDADVDAFQNGDKRIIIFSKAGGTGKSYHADKSAKNQQQRVHYLLEAGWQADNAVQGFGRSHRSNQASAPIFKLVTTNLKGQMRFISTIAKRLDQLGAMTKGQRQAGGQGMFSASDNLENSFASDVLAVFYKDLIANRVDGIDNGLAIIEKLGLKDKILDEYNSIKPTASELREVNKFLNRILSLESSEQNTIFEGYAQRLQDATEKAMIDGTLDKGLENYKADKITLNEVQDIREDERSGAKTKYYNLTAEHKIKPVKFENIPTESKSFVGFYQNKNTGVVRAVMKTSSVTDQYGNVSDNYKLVGQVKNEYIAQYRLYGNWTKIDATKAETLWNEELTKLPEYRKENLHLISGVVLPVWDKLPTENVRIYRVLTSDGEMLIGRVVSEDMIDETLRRLGSSRKREKIATKDLIEGIKNGDTVHLENGWKIIQRKVSGENRIELVGVSYEHADLVKEKGVFTERIQYNTRYFVPPNTNTEKIIDDILKLFPVMRVENSKYSSTDVSYDMASSNDTRKTEYRNYTYNALTSKPDMVVTILDDVNVRDEKGELNRADVLKRGIENVRHKNNVKNTKENAYVYIPDIDRDVLVGKRGLSHGLSRNADATALVTTKIGDVLENAIKVNELTPRKNEVGSYVLLSVAMDKNKNYYPVRVVVSQYSVVEEVEVLDVLYAINAKKKNQSSNEAELSANAGSPIKGSSVISISDLLELVKTEFSDVLTDDVLESLGVERKESNLSDSIIYKSNTNNSYDQASTTNDRWKTDNAEHKGKFKKDVSLNSIVKKIRNKFSIPIAIGKVSRKDARGVYKRKAEVIRTRIANNLPTIAHELGHHLDKLYGFSKMESVKKLIEVLPQEFINQYPTKEQGKEAVAEFVRTYLKSKIEAQSLSAGFYNDFVNSLSKRDLQVINDIADDFNYYLSMEIDEKYQSTIVNTKRSLKDKIDDVREGGIEGVKDNTLTKANETYTEWIDTFNPIKQAVDFVEKSTGKALGGTHNAYTLATNSLNSATIASYLVNDGFRDLNGNILEEMSFKECIQGVKAKDLNTLSEYLVLKHSLELINLDMRVFADDTLEDVDTINKAIERIEKEHPEMIEASENLYQYQKNMLKYYLVDSGLLSEEGFNAMVEKYPCYVPFYRDVSKKQGRAKGTFANQSTPIKRIKGSGASILNPLESIVKNTEKFVKAATRNQVMQILAEYANEVEGFGQFIEKVTPDMIPHLIDITKQKEKFTERLQQTVNDLDYFNVTNLLDEVLDDTVMDFTPRANASKKLVTVMEKGRASYYQVHDEALYKAIAEMSIPQLKGALKTVTEIMLPMKMLMTQVNPLFATSNFFRDYGTAYKHSQINNPVEFAVRYIGALKTILANDEMYQQYKAMGGGHSSKLATDIDQIQRMLHDLATKDMGKARQLVYSLFRHPLETVTSINDIVESIPRVLEFIKTLEETGDLQQAIFNADDITTNFKRHGSGVTAKVVNSMVFFNNASLQGLDKTRRSLTGKDVTAKLTKWVLFALLSSALQYFWNRYNDEEGYEQLSSYTKNSFYNYSIGDGKFISIPKPREVALLDSFTERTIEYVFGNKDAFYEFGGYLADNLLPPMLPEPTLDIEKATHDVLGNTVIGGLTDIGFNKDFMDRPIESAYEQNYLDSWERYNESTSKLAYYLGQTEWARNNDMSPKKIDHLLSSYLGIIGSAIQSVFPMDETRKDVTLGLRNRFIKDSTYSTDVINKLWDNTEKAEAQFKYDSTIDNAIEYEQNTIITNFVSQMNNAIYSLPLEEQRDARKLLLKELNRWNYELTTSQQQMKTSLADRDIDSNILLDTLPKSLYEWTENKQKYSYQMTPEEYVSFTKNYLKEIEKYRLWCKKTYTDQNEYIDNLAKANGVVMKYMRTYYNKQFKDKATKQ